MKDERHKYVDIMTLGDLVLLDSHQKKDNTVNTVNICVTLLFGYILYIMTNSFRKSSHKGH